MKRMVLIATLLHVTAAARAAEEPTFTREEVQAAYMLGRADAARDQVNATPAAISMNKKLRPPPAPAEKKP